MPKSPAGFPFLHRFIDRHGRERFYYRRHGRRVPLPGPFGSDEFKAAYSAALAGTTQLAQAFRSKPGTISAAVASYLASADFANLAAATQRERRYALEAFRATKCESDPNQRYGDNALAALRRTHIEQMLSARTPGSARNFLGALQALCSHALKVGALAANPTQGIKRPKLSKDGWLALSETDIERFEKRWPLGTTQRLALALALYTGQRCSDLARMGPQHIEGGAIKVRQAKTGKSLAIPIAGELQAAIDATAIGHLVFLINARGEPFAARDALGKFFRSACRKAGLPKRASIHGLRKACARRLALAGCSALEIVAITGHSSLSEVERYTRSADQLALAQKAIARTTSGKPTWSKLATPA